MTVTMSNCILFDHYVSKADFDRGCKSSGRELLREIYFPNEVKILNGYIDKIIHICLCWGLLGELRDSINV